MSTPAAPPPSGWYPDPQDDRSERWWNGLAWTASTRIPEPAVSPERARQQDEWQSAYEQATAGDAAGAVSPAYGATVPPVYGGPVPPAYGTTAPPAYAATTPNGYPAAVQPYGSVSPYGAAQPYGYPQQGYGVPFVTPAPYVRGMGDAIKSVLRQYATFTGRATRSEFWYWYLFNALMTIGVIILFVIGILLPPVIFVGVIAYFALILWAIGVYLPTLALDIRRLRDAALPWPLIFLALVPFGGIVLLILYCQPSKG